MPKWNIISKQTREVMGTLEAASQSEALAMLGKQADARYFELSEDARRPTVLAPLELSLTAMARIIREWAIEKEGFPPEVQVEYVLRGNQHLTMEALMARVHVPGDEEPGLEEVEEDSDEEVVVGTSQE